MDKPKRPFGFLEEIAPWIRGKKLAIYLRERPKPITGCVIKHVGHNVIVARWNSSTHLVPKSAIDYIRFAPDCDPCRDTHHTLYTAMHSRQPQRSQPQPYRKTVEP